MQILDNARIIMISDYERIAAAFVNLVIDALDVNLACALASVWFGGRYVCVCVAQSWCVWVLSEPMKNFHSLDSPPIPVVLLCGLNGEWMQ